jgi:hypothetical protein
MSQQQQQNDESRKREEASRKGEEPRKREREPKPKEEALTIQLDHDIRLNGRLYVKGEEVEVPDQLTERNDQLNEETEHDGEPLHRGDGSISGVAPTAQGNVGKVEIKDSLKDRRERANAAKRGREAGGTTGPDGKKQ